MIGRQRHEAWFGVWGHVERRDMVASFDWQPTPAGRYMVPPAVKRWVMG